MYLTRNQAGVYSASGVRIPPSPPDKKKRAAHRAALFFLSGLMGGREPPTGVRRIRQERIRTDERLALERASAEGLGAWMHPAIPMKRPPCSRSPKRHHRHTRARGDAFIANGVSSSGRRGPGARKRGRAGCMDAPSNPNEAATLLPEPQATSPTYPGAWRRVHRQRRLQLQEARPWSAQRGRAGCMDAPSNPNEAATLLPEPQATSPTYPGAWRRVHRQRRLQLREARPWSAQARKGLGAWMHPAIPAMKRPFRKPRDAIAVEPRHAWLPSAGHRAATHGVALPWGPHSHPTPGQRALR